MSPETEKEIYENLDAVWYQLDSTGSDLFLKLMWSTCSREIVPVLLRWQNNRMPGADKPRGRSNESAKVREALDKLDGTTKSAARLLTGMTPEEFAEISPPTKTE